MSERNRHWEGCVGDGPECLPRSAAAVGGRRPRAVSCVSELRIPMEREWAFRFIVNAESDRL